MTPLLSRQCRTWATFAEGKIRSVTLSFNSHLLSQVFAVDYHLKMIVYANLSKFSRRLHSLELSTNSRSRSAWYNAPNRFSGPGISHVWNSRCGSSSYDKSGQDSGLKASREVGCGKITLGITGLHEILGRDYGIEERYLGLSWDLPLKMMYHALTIINSLQ